jgi:superfamily II DNA/RNA helicase
VAPGDEKGVLLATDVLAEGQNLQQARYIVNYDMPWNPMRLVQRNGRIDRLGSPFETIKLVNLFPEGELDGILKLYETLLRKIGHANVSVGMESPVFEDVAAVDRSFGATAAAIRSIADEETRVLDEEEARLDAFSGEEFRMELRRRWPATALTNCERCRTGPDRAFGINACPLALREWCS